MRKLLQVQIAVIALAFIVGCAGGGRRDKFRVDPTPASATTAPIGLSALQTAELLLGRSLNRPAAEYYMGDHLGMNLELTLLRGGGYSLKWTGCVGLYGAAVGTWKVAGDTLVLHPLDQQGTCAEKPLRLLQIRVLADKQSGDYPILVRAEDAASFDRRGVSDHTCFRPSSIVWREMWSESDEP